MSEICIAYASEQFISSNHQALDQVAKERIYIEMIEAKPLNEVLEFQKKLIANNWPVYYAIKEEEVIGWADITPSSNPRLAHRGFLGMGVLHQYRGKGVGKRLLDAAIKHASDIGLEKVELTVYTTNTAAIKLYKNSGFSEIGIIHRYRKLDGKYFDCLEMEKFLRE
jgi:ribosomal protein S18 acetylase RimI-like enzyme